MLLRVALSAPDMIVLSCSTNGTRANIGGSRAQGARACTDLVPNQGNRSHNWSVNFGAINRETIMKKLSLFACVSAALVCAAVPVSFNRSPANVTLFSLDTAEARVGRPLTATSVAGVSRRVHRREYRRAAAGAAVGAAAVGGAGAGAAYVGGPAPVYGPGPAVAAAAPYGGPGYGYGPGPYPDSVIVNPVTGRWCRTESNGYQFCWTP
jgi:hypothetical protein